MNQLAGVGRYPLSMRVFHWVIAVAVVAQFTVGWYMAEIPDEAPNKDVLYPWHEMFGIVLLILVLARFGNRLRSLVPPLPAALPQWERVAARVVHYGMYVMLIITPILGYVMVSAHTESGAVELFGMRLPQLVAHNPAIAEFAHEAHAIAAFTLIVLALMHIAAALKHRFFDPPEMDVLKRML